MIKSSDRVKIIKLESFNDFRGKYIESFNLKKYTRLYGIDFVQDDFSYSKKNVLRGFHGDIKTWKLFSCISGKVQFAFINNNKKSKMYLHNEDFILDENSQKQILVPPNFGSAHLVLSSKAIIHYKQSTYYKQYKQFTISYNNPFLNFDWKIDKKPILSERDKN